MTHSGSFDVRSIGRRGALLLTTLAVSVGLFFAIAAGPVTKAQAGGEYFCYQVAGPWGNCFGPGGRWLTWVRALGYNHAACSNAYQNGFVTNWACAPTGTWSNAYFDGSRFMTGVVRNNTASNNQLWGYEEFL